jgi:uncharacterized protein YhdP
MGKAVRTVATLGCILLVIGMLVAGGLAWRLARGPIALDFIGRRLQSSLSAPDGTVKVDIASTALEWDPQDRDLDLRLHDVRVLGAGGTPLATIPVAAVSIAPTPLLLGRVTPRSLEAIGPRIHVVREQDGQLEVGLASEPSAGTTQLLLGSLAGGAARGGGMEGVISVRDGDLVVDDRSSGTTWHAIGLSLTARRERGEVTIDRLAFTLPPASVVATGRIAAGAATLDVELGPLPTRLFDRWWPAGVAASLRRWVLANVSGGGATTVQATIRGTLANPAAPRLAFAPVTGRATFAGLEVRWREGMPPLSHVAGTGVFAGDRWELRVARGEVEGLELVRAVVTPAPNAIRVDAEVRSPLSKALAMLERPAMRTAAAFPFRPGEISGGATARVLVSAPFDDRPAEIRARGDLRSVALRRAFRDRNVNAKRLLFDIDGREFEMRGGITVGRAPLQLRWRESLTGTRRGSRVITVKGRLDAEGRAAFGADLGSWLTGPVDVRARLVPASAGTTAMELRIDLTPASIDLPLINMVKEPGAPGAAQARLLVAGGKVNAVEDFRLNAAGTSVTGRGTLDPSERWRSAEGTVTIAPRSDGASPAQVAVALKQAAGAGSEVTVTSDDAGTAFRAVDAYADATGGRMKLQGVVRLGVPGVPLAGTLTADDFVLRRSPIIAKIAAVGGITGVIDLLASDGLPFFQLSATFTQRAGVINISEGIAAGPATALTARGTVDRGRDELSLDGTLVPNFDEIGRLTQNLPPSAIVSDLSSERTPALDFAVSGSLGDPYVTAKPATAIAPATLRSLMHLTTAGTSQTRASKRSAKGEEEGLEAEPPRGRRKSSAGKGLARSGTRSRTDSQVRSGPDGDVEATPTARTRPPRRRARAAPSAPGTDTE